MAKCANQYINFIKANYAPEKDAKVAVVIEIRAFIKLLYLARVFRENRQSPEELWGVSENGVEKFRNVLSIIEYD